MATKNGKGGKKGNARTRKSEKQEDAELVAEEDNEDDTFVFTESPACKLLIEMTLRWISTDIESVTDLLLDD